MAQILCSTGALIGMPNGRNFRLLEQLAPQLRCDGFEFMMYDTWYNQLDELVEYLQCLKLDFPVLHCEKRIGEKLSTGEAASIDEALGRFTVNCNIARQIGAKMLVVHLWNGPLSDQHFANNIAGYGFLRDIAVSHGLDLLIENVVCNTRDPMTRWAELREAYPDVHFIFDTKMAAFHNQLNALYTSGFDVCHYHVNDYAGGYMDWQNLRTLPIGRGNVNFDEFFAHIRRTGYDGTFTVEATAFDRQGVVDTTMLNGCFDAIRTYLR